MKEKFKSHLSSQANRLKSEGNIVEYIFWWIARCMMIFAVFYTKSRVAPFLYLAIVLNTLATFAVSLASFIFPQKLLLGRLSFHTQTYISYFVIMGSFFCYCVNAYEFLADYDKLQHFFAGLLGSFLGMEILKSMFPKEKIDRRVSFLCGTGFSFALIVIWEIFEFLADFFIPGSANQGYAYQPNYDMIFFKVFGKGAENAEQYHLFDTMFDMFFAFLGIIVSVFIFVVIEKIRSSRSKQ